MAHLLLYDGVCGLCNRLTQFLLRRDRQDRLRFAALQSPLAESVLATYGRDPTDLDTVYVLADYQAPSQRLLWRGRAILFALAQLGGGWRAVALLKPLPTWLLDALYRWIAKSRYRWFGRLDACLVPTAADRAKFLDAG